MEYFSECWVFFQIISTTATMGILLLLWAYFCYILAQRAHSGAYLHYQEAIFWPFIHDLDQQAGHFDRLTTDCNHRHKYCLQCKDCELIWIGVQRSMGTTVQGFQQLQFLLCSPAFEAFFSSLTFLWTDILSLWEERGFSNFHGPRLFDGQISKFCKGLKYWQQIHQAPYVQTESQLCSEAIPWWMDGWVWTSL